MLDRLTPQFLKSLDGWLLKNQPLIWRTRIHWVVFGSLVVHLLVFVAYQLYPMTTGNMPTGEEVSNFRFASVVMAGFTLFLWFLRLTRFAFVGKTLKTVLLQYGLLWTGVAAISLTLWNANKLFDKKNTELVPYTTVYADYYDCNSPNELSYEDNFKLNERYSETDRERFYDICSVLRTKSTVIISAFDTYRWDKRSDKDYKLMYSLIGFVLVIFPLIALLTSYMSLLSLIVFAFIHFLLFTGISWLSGDAGPSQYYNYLTLGGIVMGLLLYKNKRLFNWFQLFFISLIPVAVGMTFLVLQSSFHYQYYYLGHLPVPEILVSIVLLLLIGTCIYLYQHKTLKPQTT